MGARYITLSHNCHNKFADAALEENPMRKATPLHNGVSLEGRKLINEMNRVGLIVDLSHTRLATQFLVNIAPDFIACRDVGAENGLPITVPEESDLGRVVEHIMYIGDLIGFEDVTKYPDLVAELLRRGVSETDAGKIVGGNILRVWRDVEKVSAKMQAAGEPALEDPDGYEHY
ncbi:unnamed protein product [Clonostachys rosea f. rosea IK726]|uniref:Uncharacterized protein n=1 Tax=Clonostachys rosea f. rosea IK726 TaxID=1349383 RepID=A0ACA9UZU4_BIOOC|nr:unnamed protein product [Clonostachys rosea f. rosea IK726]